MVAGDEVDGREPDLAAIADQARQQVVEGRVPKPVEKQLDSGSGYSAAANAAQLEGAIGPVG